jgi:hypothetical protein
MRNSGCYSVFYTALTDSNLTSNWEDLPVNIILTSLCTQNIQIPPFDILQRSPKIPFLFYPLLSLSQAPSSPLNPIISYDRNLRENHLDIQLRRLQRNINNTLPPLKTSKQGKSWRKESYHLPPQTPSQSITKRQARLKQPRSGLSSSQHSDALHRRVLVLRIAGRTINQ